MDRRGHAAAAGHPSSSSSVPALSGRRRSLGVAPQSPVGLDEHRQWAQKLWSRLDRDRSDAITRQELNCDEFQDVIRSVMSPDTVSKAGANYARSEMNLERLLNYCLVKADKNQDGSLSFREFESFLRFLRNERSTEQITQMVFAMFDLGCDNKLDLKEFREVYRFYLGNDPLALDLQRAWEALDPDGSGFVSKATYGKWLERHASPIFKQHVPPVIGSPNGDSLQLSRTVRSPKTPVFRPAPGMVAPRINKKSVLDDVPPEWNQRFNSTDPSVQNLSNPGMVRRKQYFSRPQSLPELHRFYCTYQGFAKHRDKLTSPESPKRKLVLSTDSIQSSQLPGGSRHLPGGSMRNSSGEVMPWTEGTPRCLIKPVWAPGTLLLRVPGPPAPFLVRGRDADEDQ